MAISVRAFVLGMVCCAVLFIWAIASVIRQVNYWEKSAENYVLARKTKFYAEELLKARQAVEKTRELDTQLRDMLKMGSRRDLVEIESPAASTGTVRAGRGAGKGGPTPWDQKILQDLLDGHGAKLDEAEFVRQVRSVTKFSDYNKESLGEIGEYVKCERQRFQVSPRRWPTDGRITSKYGWRRHPISGRRDFHPALDIANNSGTLVYAAGPGTVMLADWQPGYGRMVVIDHGMGIQSRYGHMRRLYVKRGQPVVRGQKIGLMGSTGSSTAPHLHFEVVDNGRMVSPWKFLR